MKVYIAFSIDNENLSKKEFLEELAKQLIAGKLFDEQNCYLEYNSQHGRSFLDYDFRDEVDPAFLADLLNDVFL